MKPYTVEINIDLPRARVVELFDNPDNMFKWMKGLQSFEHVSGEPGQPGAVSNLVFENGKHRIEMREIVTENKLPETMHGRYEWKGGTNTLENRFIEVSPNRTRWQSTCAYRFDGFMMKLMGTLMPGVFKKQNMMFLRSFKDFCEHGRDVREPV